MISDTVKKGLDRAGHRGLLKATGVTDADMKKPFIGVANSFTDIVPGHTRLNKLAEKVKTAIREAGGVPFEFNTIAVDDGIAMGHLGMRYSLASRELIADSVETMAKAHCFDGMVCLANCDKITPGMIMGALRVNIPTLFLTGGPMQAGTAADGTKLDLIHIFEGVGKVQSGQMTEAQLKEIEDKACPSCGSCSGMFTANSMNCLLEAVGLALPGNGTISRSTWPWGVLPTRYYMPWRSPSKRGWITLWNASMKFPRAPPAFARSRPRAWTFIWRTWIGPGGSVES